MSKHMSVMGEVIMEGFLDTGSTPVRSTKKVRLSGLFLYPKNCFDGVAGK